MPFRGSHTLLRSHMVDFRSHDLLGTRIGEMTQRDHPSVKFQLGSVVLRSLSNGGRQRQLPDLLCFPTPSADGGAGGSVQPPGCDARHFPTQRRRLGSAVPKTICLHCCASPSSLLASFPCLRGIIAPRLRAFLPRSHGIGRSIHHRGAPIQAGTGTLHSAAASQLDASQTVPPGRHL